MDGLSDSEYCMDKYTPRVADRLEELGWTPNLNGVFYDPDHTEECENSVADDFNKWIEAYNNDEYRTMTAEEVEEWANEVEAAADTIRERLVFEEGGGVSELVERLRSQVERKRQNGSRKRRGSW